MAISDNQRDDNADTRQKNQPDSVISNGVWYESQVRTLHRHRLQPGIEYLKEKEGGEVGAGAVGK